MGLNQADKHVRTEEVFHKRQDLVQPNVTYFGQTPTFTTLDSEPLWQIWRVSYTLGKWETFYANAGKYNCIWDNRGTYFPALPPAEEPPGLGVTQHGLHIAGRITEIVLNAVTWVALPTVPLAQRNAISIQNMSGIEVKVQFDNTVVGYTGIYLPDGYERTYDITEAIPIYAKASAGTPTVVIEELA